MTHIDSIFRKITKTNIYTHLVGLFSPWYTVGKTLRQINILGLECVCFFCKFARFCLTKLVNNSRIKWINGPTQLLPVKKNISMKTQLLFCQKINILVQFTVTYIH